ncbi:hypothetical protein [Streptomyces sp. NPDC053427]|uniref:hypothetical protein n=1 Tax=Streptomyces sp. NPDC053427 TaxID=3365701 RepID=UPI0037CDE976
MTASAPPVATGGSEARKAPSTFLAFRDGLGTASGAQSAQFHEIEILPGRQAPPRFERMPWLTAAERTRHVLVVERQTGGKPGTGGSAGASSLKARADARFFPELWRFRPLLGPAQ